MQFQISKSAIVKALSNVNGAVERRNTIPVLLNVKIEAKDGRLNLTATDMDIVIISSAEALISREGSTTVPAQLFYDIIKKIPDNADINAELNDDNSIKISYGRSKFSLPCLDPSEFPVLSEGEMTVSFNIKSSELIKIIDKTRFAIPSDETRYYLNGLFIHGIAVDGGIELRAVATDGHRLALASSTKSSLTSEVAGVIVPKKTISEIRKIIEGDKEVQVSFSKAKIRISSGSSVIISKLIDGEFPEYDRVIPKGNDQLAKIDRKELFNAMDRVSTIAVDKNKSIKFILENGKISLQIKGGDNGNASEEIEAEFSGEIIETGFNSRYFLEIIGQINKDKLNIYFKDGMSPALIKNSEEELYVIMPIRV
ncbi:MAG: DNA polymerase-3 subunit beta [Rickettsiales bacterium]|jgi:DNA polymerase-3 subunit beta